MCELSAAKRRADRMEEKLKKLRQLVVKAEKEKAETLQVTILEEAKSVVQCSWHQVKNKQRKTVPVYISI